MAGEEYNEKYIEQKFENVMTKLDGLVTLFNANFENIDEQLDRIEAHAKLTNSRVSHAEDDIVAVNKRIDEAMTWANHIVDTRPTGCPNLDRVIQVENEVRACKNEFTKSVGELKKKLEDVFFIAKYPKLFLGAIVVAVLISIATLISNNPFSIFDKANTTEQVESINK